MQMQMNATMEGIKKISIGEVIPDYEEPEEEQK